MNHNIYHAALGLVIAASIFACGGGNSGSNDSLNSNPMGSQVDNTVDPSGDGALTVNITDAPVDGATEVIVKFDAIEIKPESGASFTRSFDEAKMIDLLSLQNGATAPLLQDEVLPAGNYEWMRLMVDADRGEMDSYIKFDDGSMYSLYVPSGSNTGLKLNRGFTIAVGMTSNFTLDFDLRKSIHKPMSKNSDDYFLRPTIRMMDNTEVGAIAGYINPSVVADISCEQGLAVYAYTGADVEPDDEASATPPLTSSMPVYDATNDRYDYRLSFLSTGEYTVAVTCDADIDDPEMDDDTWSYITKLNVVVNLNQTSELNFE